MILKASAANGSLSSAQRVTSVSPSSAAPTIGGTSVGFGM